MALRIATFNILHGAALTDGSSAPERLTEAITSLDADVLALQEVDRDQPRSGSIDQARVAAAALGARDWRFVPSLLGTPDGTRSWQVARAADDSGSDLPSPAAGPAYGIALLSRHPVREWHVRRFRAPRVALPLLVPAVPRARIALVPDEPRVAVAAVLDTPDGPLTVVATHLSFVPAVNALQLRRLVAWAQAFPAPRLLVGDLNLVGPLPGVISRWPQLARTATYPAPAPRVQFDHVLGSGLSTGSVRSTTAPVVGVSDHRPLVVELDLPRL